MTTWHPLLAGPGLLTVRRVFDGVSARLAAAAGFPVPCMTGYGAVASAYGPPDTGLATCTEMVDRVRLLADGDTGHGAPSDLRRTVRDYEQAGAAAIQIEDQRFPNSWGHAVQPIPVVQRDEAVQRLRAAVGSRRTDAFLVVARTDARRPHGLDEVLRRAALFLAESFRGVPLVANMARGGRALVDALLAAVHAMRRACADLHRHGVNAAAPPMASLAELGAPMGADEIARLDTDWTGAAP